MVVVLPEPCRPTIMIAIGAGAFRSTPWPSAPSVATSSSCTIFTTIWPGVTDLMTSMPTARSRTLSTKARATSSATSASSNARRTSRSAASTSASDSAPRLVRRSRMPPSFSDKLSNIRLSFLSPLPNGRGRRPELAQRPNDLTPEGASRCRAGPPASWTGRRVSNRHLLRERPETRDFGLSSQPRSL